MPWIEGQGAEPTMHYNASVIACSVIGMQITMQGSLTP